MTPRHTLNQHAALDRPGIAVKERNTPGTRWVSRAISYRAVAIVLVLSAALKLALLSYVTDLRPYRDERQYLAAARSVVAHGEIRYPNPIWDEAHVPPLMPYFLASCLALAGEDHFESVARGVQVVLSTLSVLFVYLIAAQVFNARVAKISAAAVAFYPTLIAFTHYFWSETVYIFFFTAFTAALLRNARRSSVSASLLSGLCGGAGALTRSALVAQIPLAALSIIVCAKGSRRIKLAATIALLAGLMVIIGPWILRNAFRYRQFLLIDTNSGNVLYKNFNVVDPENYDVGLEDRWKAQVAAYRGAIPMRRRAVADNVVDRQRAEVRAAIGFVARHPLLYLRHCVIRAAELVNPTSFLVRHIRHGFYRRLSGFQAEALVWCSMGSAMVVMAGAVVGLSTGPSNAGRTMLMILIFGHLALCVLVISQSRYRLPAIPLLIPFAVDAVLRFKELVHVRRHWKCWLVAVPVLAFMIVCWVRYIPYSFA